MESISATAREASRLVVRKPRRPAPAASEPPPPPPPPPSASASASGGWGLPLAVLVAGMFMSILDISIVNVAMASMSKDFGTSTEDMQWISTAYSLTEGVVVPISAWVGARLGLKRVYVWSLALFTVGSALCGLA